MKRFICLLVLSIIVMSIFTSSAFAFYENDVHIYTTKGKTYSTPIYLMDGNGQTIKTTKPHSWACYYLMGYGAVYFMRTGRWYGAKVKYSNGTWRSAWAYLSTWSLEGIYLHLEL